MVDHVRERVETILNSEGESVVLGAEELGNLKSSLSIGSTGQTNGERVQLCEDSHSRQVVLVVNTNQAQLSPLADAIEPPVICKSLHAKSLTLGNRGDQAGVETTRQQHTIWDLRHQTLANRPSPTVTDSLIVDGGRGYVVGSHQVGSKYRVSLSVLES